MLTAGLILVGVAVAAWIVGAVSAVAMVRHRAPGISLFQLATQGHRFFGSSNFTPAAAPHRRRFLIAFGVFFLAVIIGIALTMFAAE